MKVFESLPAALTAADGHDTWVVSEADPDDAAVYERALQTARRTASA